MFINRTFRAHNRLVVTVLQYLYSTLSVRGPHRLNSAFSAKFSLTLWQIFGNDAMAAIRQPATILLGLACISTRYVSARGDGV
jgi:hypothetical protein